MADVRSPPARFYMSVRGPVGAEDDRLVLNVPEAGALLGLSRNAAYEAAKNGQIPVVKIGKLLKVPKAALMRLLDQAESSSNG
jgi:excisionase family DNA binding protein